jgi:AAA family ATP:ADP antiporter
MSTVDGSRSRRAFLLGAWFFLTIANLWLLKPVRTASLLAHLGSAETPWVRLASALFVGVVVLGYSRLVDRTSRLGIAAGANIVCAVVLLTVWSLLQLFGETLGRTRPFVWSLYVLVDVYAVVIVGIFWTYANDVMTREEADASYGPVGLGGILGGVAGGAFADLLARPVGPENLLLVCTLLSFASAAVAIGYERRFRPAPRVRAPSAEREGLSSALEGVRSIMASKYLLLVVAIVVAYEFTATLTDFAINVVFEQTYHERGTLAKMYGRLGWIASGVAIAAQLVAVPLLLPRKRIALAIPPLAMALGAVGLLIAPVILWAVVLTAADRGLNYSLQQVTKETLYVPLDDVQKYKAKAAIDMIVDRSAKAGAAIVLVFVIAREGLSTRTTLLIALVSIVGWFIAAIVLGRLYVNTVGARTPRDDARVSSSTPRIAS